MLNQAMHTDIRLEGRRRPARLPASGSDNAEPGGTRTCRDTVTRYGLLGARQLTDRVLAGYVDARSGPRGGVWLGSPGMRTRAGTFGHLHPTWASMCSSEWSKGTLGAAVVRKASKVVWTESMAVRESENAQG